MLLVSLLGKSPPLRAESEFSARYIFENKTAIRTGGDFGTEIGLFSGGNCHVDTG